MLHVVAWVHILVVSNQCKMSPSFDVISAQNIFDRSLGAADGWQEEVLCMFVFALQPSDLTMILKGGVGVSSKPWCMLPCPSLTLLPFYISCVIMERTLSSELICVAGRPLALFSTDTTPSNIIPLCPGSPLALKKDLGSLKCRLACEPFKVYPMPHAQQGS